jgi:hypothetical protein
MTNFKTPEIDQIAAPIQGESGTLPVNGISSEEAMRFGPDNSNPGHNIVSSMNSLITLHSDQTRRSGKGNQHGERGSTSSEDAMHFGLSLRAKSQGE